MAWRWKWVVLWSLWAARLVRQPTLPVRVTGGLLRGLVALDGSYVEYLNVPYATLDSRHRFQAPGPEPTWEGVYDAVDEHVKCPQRYGDSIVLGQQNCLTLNIYTPTASKSDTRLPVMVYIHGGGFFEGSGSKFIYGPDYLVTKDIILVTINYRLNIQGFLCLGIKEAPGNAGLKDQVAALKWVQRNIKVFGGDPDNVTIFGESAGGASVSYHVLSPASKGLFHKAIMQSGSSLAPWAHQNDPILKASLHAKEMGFNTQDPHEIYKIFMNKSDRELIVTRVPRKEGDVILSELFYIPCTEKVIDGVESFLTETPYDILAKGTYNKVPMIIGTNNEEGLLLAAMENDTTIAKLDFEKSMPANLEFPSMEDKKISAAKLKSFYLGNDDISKDTILNISRFHGEPFFNYPASKKTELILKTNDKPVYNYLFSYSGVRNVPKLLAGSPFSSAPGATHADELFYLFHQNVLPLPFENKMVDRMLTLWTNFAKYGDPTPQVTELLPMRWLPTQRKDPRVMVLDDQLSTAPLYNTDSLLYWRQLYTKYRRK